MASAPSAARSSHRRRLRSAWYSSTLSTRYSVKCASFRMNMCHAFSSSGPACGKMVASSGRSTAPVRSPVNQPVEKNEISPAHASAGSHRRARCSRGESGNLGDGAIDEVENLLAELGIDEALELLTLGGVALAAGVLRELRAGEHVEKLEHAGMRAGVAARELPIERQPQRQVGQPVLEVLVQLHANDLLRGFSSRRPGRVR